MKRFLSGLLFGGVITALAVACDSSSSGGGTSFGYGGTGYAQAQCSNYGVCEACTPQLGCGWCSLPDGTGACLPDPGECQGSQSTWTWDPSGCRTAANPTVGPEAEGGTSAPDAAFGVGVIEADGAASDGAAADSAAGDGAPAKDGEAPVADSGSNSVATPDTGAGVTAADSGAPDGAATDAGASTADAQVDAPVTDGS